VLVVTGPERPYVKCEHCHGSGRNAGIDCGVCHTKGVMPAGFECPCPSCKEMRQLGW
jgi:hypothetical protein